MPAAEISSLARQDIEDIAGYIANDSPEAARKFIDATRKTIDLLTAFPLIGKLYNDDIHVKLVSMFDNYLIFYRPTPNGLFVFRILHAARDIPRVLDA